MGKTINISQDNLITLKENMVGINDASHKNFCHNVDEASAEVDEFEIGQESDNPPLGGNYFHVEEGVNFDDKSMIIKQIYDVISLAKEKYGTTSNMNQAGYILPDGSLLSFGSDGYRDVDHRAIKGVYLQNNIPIWSDEYRYNYVVDFMNHGAIRCDVNTGILDMTKEPTSEQYSAIKMFVRKAEDIDIDFTDERGNTIHSVSYENANPQQVVGDIYRYYNEGIKPQGNVQYEEKKIKHTNLIIESQESKSLVSENQLSELKENLDFEVNSSDIDLSSFKKRDELAPRIWEDEETLNPRIRLKLLDIADDFWEFVNLTWVKPSGIILTGSICNFNWSKFSDIDLHLIVDFDEIDEKTEFVRDYLDAKKNEWNNEHEGLTMLGYPVELYVQNLDEMPKSGGIYDLEENAWLVKPNPHSVRPIGLNKFSIKDKAAKIMTIIDDMYDTFKTTDDSHEIDAIGSDAKYLWQKIKRMRKDSLANEGEWGNGNIVYKCLRREGYLDKLWKLRTLCYDSINSINESVSQTQDIFTNVSESIEKYKNVITLLKEETVADGSSNGNPYNKRWKAEREALKNFICNYGTVMQSKEDNKQGKLYKCFWDKALSQLIGYNYCLCVQWDAINMKPKSVVYIRACDKFTPNIRQNIQYDTRGMDNQVGTYDDRNYQNIQQ